MPDVVPFLTYEDGIAALDWLAEVFGFTETARLTSSDGRLFHGEMSIGDGVIMLASPSPEYESPKRHRGNCGIAASWSALPWIIDGVLVYVEDVDAHYARVKAAGATILSDPEDGLPARRYRVRGTSMDVHGARLDRTLFTIATGVDRAVPRDKSRHKLLASGSRGCAEPRAKSPLVSEKRPCM